MSDKIDTNISVPVRKPNPSIQCPVCGGTLCVQIPDKEAVVEEQLYQLDTVCIIASEVVVACEFEHILDEDHENYTLDNPHPLISMYRIVFDDTGLCTAFDFLGIRPGLQHVVEGTTVTTLVEKLQRTGLVDKELALTDRENTAETPSNP